MDANDAFTVLLVDDHPLFVDAMKLALRPMVRRPVFLVARTLAESLAECARHVIDLAIVDIVLPDVSGLDGISRIATALGPHVPLVVMSGRDDGSTVQLLQAMGLRGFVSKATPLAQIQDRIRVVLDGGSTFPADDDGLAGKLAGLSPAQAKVLVAAASGKLNKQIAFETELSEATVKSHMSAIIKKLGVQNRTQAILMLSKNET